MQKIYCDIDGRDITEDRERAILTLTDPKHARDFDVCKECRDAFVTWKVERSNDFATRTNAIA